MKTILAAVLAALLGSASADDAPKPLYNVCDSSKKPFDESKDSKVVCKYYKANDCKEESGKDGVDPLKLFSL